MSIYRKHAKRSLRADDNYQSLISSARRLAKRGQNVLLERNC